MKIIDGPFVWEESKVENRTSADCREFRLADERVKEAIGNWGLKQYSARTTRDSPFSGWRLVSGGPFGPGYNTPLECARGATREFRKMFPEWIRLAKLRLDAATNDIVTLQALLTAMSKGRRKAS